MVIKLIEFENFQVVIGGNALDNDDLFHQANQNDYWFHASKLPSVHVWLRTKSTEPDTNMITTCAEYVKDNCRRAGNRLRVDYTQRRDLFKNADCKVGEVVLKRKPQQVVI